MPMRGSMVPHSATPLSDQSLQLRIAALGQHDANMGVEVSMSSRLLRQAPALQSQHLVRTRPLRHVDGQPARRRLHGHLGAEDCIVERYRQIRMEVAAFHTVARMPAKADRHQRVARLATHELLALSFQPDRLAVLDIGGQLDGNPATVREESIDLCPGCRVLDVNVQRGTYVIPPGRCPARAAGTVFERLAENLVENIVAAEGIGAVAAGAEFEPRAARPMLRTTERGEGVRAGMALEALEPLLALSVDLASIIGGPLPLVRSEERR